jgi:hypothetical protein
MPAAPRVGRNGRWPGFGLRRLRRRVERAHNAVYAWICKPILAAGQAPRPQAPAVRADGVPRAASGARATRAGSPAIDVPFGWIEEISRQLSERSCATASAVAGSLSEDVLARLLLSDTLADATRLLEAAPPLPPVNRGARQPDGRAPQARRCDVGRNMARLVVVNRRLRPAGPARLRSLDRHRASNGRDPGQSRARLAHRGYCGRGLTPCGMRLMHRPEVMKTRTLGSSRDQGLLRRRHGLDSAADCGCDRRGG